VKGRYGWVGLTGVVDRTQSGSGVLSGRGEYSRKVMGR
jgi:hypothetical protein